MVTENVSYPRRSAGLRARLDRVRWWAAWRPAVTVGVGNLAGFVLGNAVAVPADVLFGSGLVAMVAMAALGLVVGVGTWLSGVRFVGNTAPALLDEFRDASRISVASSTVSEGCVWTLKASSGSTPLLTHEKRYAFTHLCLDEATIVCSRAGFNMVDRTRVFEDPPFELPYAAIRSVEYVDRHVVIETVDGRIHRYPSDRNPSGTICALREALSRAKSSRDEGKPQ